MNGKEIGRYALDGVIVLAAFLILRQVWGYLGTSFPIFATIAGFGLLGATVGDALALIIAGPIGDYGAKKLIK